MSPFAYLLFFLVLAFVGGLMCQISAPMVRERAGPGYRVVAVVLCGAGGVLLIAAVACLVQAVSGLPI